MQVERPARALRAVVAQVGQDLHKGRRVGEALGLIAPPGRGVLVDVADARRGGRVVGHLERQRVDERAAVERRDVGGRDAAAAGALQHAFVEELERDQAKAWPWDRVDYSEHRRSGSIEIQTSPSASQRITTCSPPGLPNGTMMKAMPP